MKAIVLAAALSLSMHAQAACLAPVSSTQEVDAVVSAHGGYNVPADACLQIRRNRMALEVISNVDTSQDATVAWTIIKLRDERLPIFSQSFGTTTLVGATAMNKEDAAHAMAQSIDMALQNFSYTEAMAQIRALRAKREIPAQ
ncbi:hypothetical protein [Herbaspirillum robiniae]|nr:hypothetical protein [Herbaspirillum robiniae]NUU01971.1 hypothetical protein [Herbaspirillum robiniae]